VLEVERKFTEAEAMHRNALAARRKLPGRQQIDVAESLNKLAELLWQQHRRDEAEPMFREALEIRLRLSPDDAPGMAMSFRNLGGVLREQGRLSEAVQIYREALPKYLEAWPGDLEQDLRPLSEELFHQNKSAELDLLFESILTPAAEHRPKAVEILRVRGTVRARRGQFPEAALDFRRIVDLSSERAHDWFAFIVLLVRTGQTAACHEFRQKALERFAQTTEPSAADQIAKGCLLRPDSRAQLEFAARLADFAVQAT
jgi:tetratricopeptide (TPR) repeat protein